MMRDEAALSDDGSSDVGIARFKLVPTVADRGVDSGIHFRLPIRTGSRFDGSGRHLGAARNGRLQDDTYGEYNAVG